MDIRSSIWHDFLNAKIGDEYLSRYITAQKRAKRWLKMATVAFSAGGIFSAIKDFNVPTIIIMFAIAIVQLVNLFGTMFLHSDDDLQNLFRLKMMYHNWANSLEQLFANYECMNQDDSKNEFFKLRETFKNIEELDNKVYIHFYKKMREKARLVVTEYINTYHNG